MKNYIAKKPYALVIPATLFEEWGWFEHRGYLPPLPGEVWRDAEAGIPWLCGEASKISFLSEAEAWEFSEAWEALGEAAGACVADLDPILDFLEGIV